MDASSILVYLCQIKYSWSHSIIIAHNLRKINSFPRMYLIESELSTQRNCLSRLWVSLLRRSHVPFLKTSLGDIASVWWTERSHSPTPAFSATKRARWLAWNCIERSGDCTVYLQKLYGGTDNLHNCKNSDREKNPNSHRQGKMASVHNSKYPDKWKIQGFCTPEKEIHHGFSRYKSKSQRRRGAAILDRIIAWFHNQSGRIWASSAWNGKT